MTKEIETKKKGMIIANSLTIVILLIIVVCVVFTQISRIRGKMFYIEKWIEVL